MQENCGYSRKRLYKYLIELVIDPMPKLSVIVPVYNTEKYLRECVDSILAQTFTDFELILVDDGSTDSSGAICDEYAGKDPRIQVIHQKNGGITVARKSGVRAACGEYVTFVDSDDWIDKNMYHTMLTQEPADIVICNIIRARNDGMFELRCRINPGKYDKQKLIDHFYPVMLFDFDCSQPAVHPSLCNKLIRREIIRNVLNNVADSITYGEDALCSYACMLDAENIRVMDQGLYYYRENLQSVCNVYNKEMFSKLILLGTELERQFAERNCDLESQVFGYLAMHSLECIRNELLYHTGVTVSEKKDRVNRFVNDPLLTKAICYTFPRIKDRKTKFKLLLAKKKLIVILYLFYLGRNSQRKR